MLLSPTQNRRGPLLLPAFPAGSVWWDLDCCYAWPGLSLPPSAIPGFGVSRQGFSVKPWAVLKLGSVDQVDHEVRDLPASAS